MPKDTGIGASSKRREDVRFLSGRRSVASDTGGGGELLRLSSGRGWAMTGACPGPLYAQIGTGALVVVVTLVSAVAGTWVYGYVREQLPH